MKTVEELGNEKLPSSFAAYEIYGCVLERYLIERKQETTEYFEECDAIKAFYDNR